MHKFESFCGFSARMISIRILISFMVYSAIRPATKNDFQVFFIFFWRLGYFGGVWVNSGEQALGFKGKRRCEKAMK